MAKAGWLLKKTFALSSRSWRFKQQFGPSEDLEGRTAAQQQDAPKERLGEPAGDYMTADLTPPKGGSSNDLHILKVPTASTLRPSPGANPIQTRALMQTNYEIHDLCY